MSRKRKHSREGVLIDITSLLDVIFILLLVVMCGYVEQNQKLAQEASLASKAQAEAEAASAAYADMINTQNELQSLIWTASITVPYDPDEITRRQLKVINEDTDIISIDLVGNNVAGNVQEFKDSLTEYIEKHSDCPVILSLNDNNDKILYRDEKAVEEVLQELMNSYSNVYIKGHTREE